VKTTVDLPDDLMRKAEILAPSKDGSSRICSLKPSALALTQDPLKLLRDGEPRCR
jgi:hypothetical protein